MISGAQPRRKAVSTWRRKALATACLCVCWTSVGLAQSDERNLPDAPTPKTAAGTAAEPDDGVSLKNLPRRILRDQKDIWLFPVQLARGRHLLPTLAAVGGTAGLIVADPHAMPYFRTHASNWDDFNDTFDGTITSAEMGLVP